MVRPSTIRSFVLLAFLFACTCGLYLWQPPLTPPAAAHSAALVQGTPVPAPVPVWRLTDSPKDALASGLAVLNGQIYLSAANGVWMSADGGVTWQARNNGLPEGYLNSISAQSGALFVVTQAGIYRSDNGGLNWRAANVGLPNTLTSNLFTDNDKLYAMSYGSGLFSSTDKGETWTPTGTLPALATSANAALRGNTVWIGTSRGIYRSTDGGITWTRAHQGAPADAQVSTFAYVGDRLLAAFSNALRLPKAIPPGVYAWDDREGAWKAFNQGLEPTSYLNLFADGVDVFVGTELGAYRLDADKQSWVAAGNGLRGETFIFARNGSSLYAVSGGDLFVSPNRGDNWRALNVSLAPVTQITAFAFNNTALYAATNSGIYRRLNVGPTAWARASNGLTSSVITDLATQAQNLWATSSSGQVFFSDDNGQSWTSISNLLDKQLLTSIATNERTVLIGGPNDGLFNLVRFNMRSQWHAANQGLTTRRINDLLSVGNAFFAATGNGVFRSTDDGASWTAVNQGLSLDIAGQPYEALRLSADGSTIYGILAPRPTDDSTIPVVLRNPPFSQAFYVFRSNDNGTTWTRVDFHQGSAAEFEQVLPTAQGLLALGSGAPIDVTTGLPSFVRNSLWFSNDKAATWTPADAGLLTYSSPFVYQLTDLSYGLLGATSTQAWLSLSYGRGLYVRDLVSMSCRYELSKRDGLLPPVAGTQNVTLRTTDNCRWSAESLNDWITITGAASGTGSGEVRVSFAANAGTIPRTGVVVIGGTAIALTQAACELDVSSLQHRFEANGGNGSFNILAGGGCQWELRTEASWITLPTTRRGMGNATISFSVAANPNNQPRTATVYVNTLAVTVTQAAAQGSCAAQPLTVNQWKRDSFTVNDCTADFYTFSAPSQSQRWFVAYYGPTAEPAFNVTDAAGKNLQIEDVVRLAVFRGGFDLRLLTFITASTGTHTLWVASARSKDEKPYWVRLSQGECISRIRGNDRELKAAGDNDTLAVSAPTGCEWAVISTAPWLRVSTTANAVNYAADENLGAARSAAILVGDLSFTVKQAAAANAGRTLTGLDPSFVELGATGALLTVTGNGFTNNSKVLFGDKPLATSFVNATQLRAAIPTTELASAREVLITVETASPNVWQTPALPFVIRPAQQFWAATNGPGGGQITALHRQGTQLWTGTANGRIFRSDDEGRTWRRHAALSGNNLAFGYIGYAPITKIAASGHQLVAVTPSTVYRLNLNQSNAAWTPIQMPEDFPNGSSPYVSDLVAKNDSVLAVINYQLYRATASSPRWTRVGDLPFPSNFQSFAILLETAGTAANAPLYVLQDRYDLTSNERLLYVSTNEGQSWRRIALAFPDDARLPLFGLGISLKLFVLNNRVYFGVGNGVFRLDEREQLVRVGNTPAAPGSGPRNVTALVQDGDTLYASSYESLPVVAEELEQPQYPTLFRLESNGRWVSASEGIESAFVSALLVTPVGLFAGTSVGLWQSANRGTTWSERNQGLNALNIHRTTAIGNAVFAASVNGIYRSANNGQTWTRADHGLPLTANAGIALVSGNLFPTTPVNYFYGISALAANGDTLFAALNEGIFRSTDQGQSWRNMGMVSYQTSAFGFVGQQTLAAAWKYGSGLGGLTIPYSLSEAGIYRTSSVTGGWRTSESALFNNLPTSLMILNGKVFAGTTNSGIRVSDDNGQTWRMSNQGLGTNQIYTLTNTGNMLLAGTDQGIYRSSDQGQTWRLTNAPFESIGQLVAQGNTVYALCQSGVYRTDNLGEDWRQLPPATGHELATLQPLGTRLFAGTNGDSVLLADLAPTTATAVNAASYAGGQLAPLSIATLFGGNFSTATELAASDILPDELAGTRVLVRGSNGSESYAPLYFVSPGQINFLMPALEPDSAPVQIFVTSRSGTQSIANIQITPIALGLFTANGNGQGVPAAVALRVRADGSSSYESLARFDAAQNRWVPLPIDVSPANGTVYLVLYGTGISRRGNSDSVTATAGDMPLNVVYAGPQGSFTGLDQLNITLPAALAGRGEIELRVTANGRATNAVRIAIR